MVLALGVVGLILLTGTDLSVGLVNVNNRIKILFGEKYGLKMGAQEYGVNLVIISKDNMECGIIY